ncbi:MAG: hypothetical protein NTY23_00435 [Chloroflexi bacterium]|nr:hypothetical protein [Chloroflexota bacterium]
MLIPYDFESCIVCQERAPGDPEHVIPECIGGRLEGRMLCNPCNATFGSQLVALLKKDPSITFAMEQLKDRVPSLYAKFMDKAEFIGTGRDRSTVRASVSKGRLRVLAGTGVNESLILDTDEALGAIARRMRRKGMNDDERNRWTEAFKDLSDDVPMDLPTGGTIVKRPLPQLRPRVGAPAVDHRLLALIAFDYLALLIGKAAHRSSFEFVREGLHQAWARFRPASGRACMRWNKVRSLPYPRSRPDR